MFVSKMVLDGLLDPRRYSPRVLLFVGILGLTLLVASFLVEVRVVLQRPEYGDVTGVLQTLVRGVLGIATVGSFLIAVRELSSDGEPSRGPATGFEIKGEHHDIDFHLHVSELSEPDETDDCARDAEKEGPADDPGERSAAEADASEGS